MNLVHLWSEWAPSATQKLVVGIVVALAFIPEGIAFSAIAGVGPNIGFYASFCVGAFAGGRPVMISAATCAVSLLMISIVKEHEVGYLFAATLRRSIKTVRIDLNASSFCNISGINALDRAVLKFWHPDAAGEVIGMNTGAALMVSRISTDERAEILLVALKHY